MRFRKLVIYLAIIMISGAASGVISTFMFQIELGNEQDNYNDLWNDYNELSDEYDDLLNEYYGVIDDYNDLVDDYNDLVDNYNFLFGEYQSILSVLEDPMTSHIIPTISQVQSWLVIDDTEDSGGEYIDGEWMCGDFAAMLMVRAKAMNWRIRIACMFWSYEGEDGWEDVSDPYGSYGHAFNLIICQDGNDDDSYLDVYYIEPQSDQVWYVHYGDYNHEFYGIWYTFGGGISGTVWSEPYFINHYSEFA